MTDRIRFRVPDRILGNPLNTHITLPDRASYQITNGCVLVRRGPHADLLLRAGYTELPPVDDAQQALPFEQADPLPPTDLHL